MSKISSWIIYLLECQDGTYYTGITNNLDRRIKMHIKGTGSKYVYSKGFKKVLGFKSCYDRSKACIEEYRVKKMTRAEKLSYFI